MRAAQARCGQSAHGASAMQSKAEAKQRERRAGKMGRWATLDGWAVAQEKGGEPKGKIDWAWPNGDGREANLIFG